MRRLPVSRPTAGRIYSYDVTGGRYPEQYYHSVGSGSVFAKRFAEEAAGGRSLSEDEAVAVAVEALYDAADDDSATGGPDLTRRIYPMVFTATADGTRRIAGRHAGHRWSGPCWSAAAAAPGS